MNDLYSGLMSSYLRKGKNGQQFWGLYDPLDKIETPTENLLFQTQINQLKILEKSKKYDTVNEFLKQSQKKFDNYNSTSEDELNNEVYSRIIEILNAGLRGSPLNPHKNLQGLSESQKTLEVDSRIKSLSLELSNLLKQIRVSQTLSKSMVSSLENRLRSFDWNVFPHQYIMEKADLVEALMVDKLNQNPALKAIVTGSWLDISGQQLIEDAFAFSQKNLDVPFSLGSLKFIVRTDKGNFSQSAISIGDFLNQLEKVNNTSFKVQLSDELYEALKQSSAIAGQAKSGMRGQAILNKNQRNSLSLKEVNFDPMLLWDLYELDKQTKTKFFKNEKRQNSKTLNALCNYCLSKNIAKTALKENQLYLTAEGFVSASQWMENTGEYLIFNPDIKTISGDFLTKKRRYIFTK